MARIKITLTAVCCCLAWTSAWGQGLASLGFYNAENLYDTIPSLFYDDGDHTPQGRLRWNTERYQTKLRNIARVADGMALDVLCLSEVESEGAVRDLVGVLTTDYNYIHRISGDRRGMDLAVLYKGDRFVPTEVRVVPSATPRGFLYVRGLLCGHDLHLVVCHLPSQLNRRHYRSRAAHALATFADSLLAADPAARIVITGDFNATPRDRTITEAFGRQDAHVQMFCPFDSLAAAGAGSYLYDRRWRLYDYALLSPAMSEGPIAYSRCGIYIKPWLLEGGGQREGSPLRTFSGRTYRGGYSDHLPVFLYFETSPVIQEK